MAFSDIRRQKERRNRTEEREGDFIGKIWLINSMLGCDCNGNLVAGSPKFWWFSYFLFFIISNGSLWRVQVLSRLNEVISSEMAWHRTNKLVYLCLYYSFGENLRSKMHDWNTTIYLYLLYIIIMFFCRSV